MKQISPEERQEILPFMEQESSLPCSREPTNDNYLEPHESNIISLRSFLILSSHPRLYFNSGLPLQRLSTKTVHEFRISPCMIRDLPTSTSFILSH
jgi:hypothetical protein